MVYCSVLSVTVKFYNARSEDYIISEQMGCSMAFSLPFPFSRISSHNLLHISRRIRQRLKQQLRLKMPRTKYQADRADRTVDPGHVV